MRADPGHPLRRALPALDLVLTYGGGPPVVDAYARASAPAPACRSTTRSTRRPTIRSPPEPALRRRPRLPRQPPARPRGAGRARSSSSRPRGCPSGASCSAATAGTTSRCSAQRAPPRPCRHGASTTPSTPRRSRCSTSPATAWPTIGFSPATRVFEAAGAGACLITDAWEGIELFLAPGEEVLVARDGQDVAEHLAALDARARARDRRAPRRRASCAEHTYARRGARGRRAAARGWPQRQARADASHEARRPRPQPRPRPGATATPRPTARCSRAFAARGHDVTFLERDVPWYAGPHRDLPDPGFCRLAFYADLGRPRGAGATRSPRADAVIVGSYVPDGVAVGALGAAHGDRASSPSTTSTRR